MHVSRRLGEDRGAIMVLTAILVPVLLVLTALIYDGGTWFTHKRQLQNRADAGALAAGVQYTTAWAACGSSDAQTKLDAANAIDDAARQYAGDPSKTGSLALHNTELTDQNRINIEINSNAPGGHVDPGTSWNDPGGSGLGPCDQQTSTDRFSPIAGAHYVDVGVRERDQRSLFGMFGVDLFRNEAHARVQLETAVAGKGFLPLAIPDQDVRQVEIRYFWSCSPDPSAPTTPIGAPITLQPLANAYQTKSGTAYWGPTLNNQKNGVPIGINLNIPDEKACGAASNYISIREEVRLAGVDPSVLNLDAHSCAELVDLQFADCWTNVSEVRVDKDTPKTEPWFHHVVFTGGAGAGQCSPDPYFSKLPAGDDSCSLSGSVDVDWNGYGTSPPTGRVCSISIGGTTKDFPDCAKGSVTFSGMNSTLGQSTYSLTWTCMQPGPPDKKGNPGPPVVCPGANASTPITIRSLFLGNRQNSSLVTQVVTSQSPWTNGNPGPPIDWVDAPQNTPGANGLPITVYPTVGLEGSLYVGQRRVLRAPHCKNAGCTTIDTSSPIDSMSVDCEPTTGGQGHDFVMFANGCRPWYGPNHFDDTTWWKPPCPVKDPTTGFDGAPPNGPGAPWRCLVKAPGFSPPVIGAGIAAAIGNCVSNGNNSCSPSSYNCNNWNFYDPTKPDQWAIADQNGDGKPDGNPSPRVVYLFIVPYGAYKSTSSQTTVPILSFAAFYVTGWNGNGGHDNPCTSDPDGSGPALKDEDPSEGTKKKDSGDIVGYFVDYTMPDAPGDPHSICVVGQLQPCVPVLVR